MPFPQFSKTFQNTEIPEFHTQINIITKRVYLRGLEYIKVQDAHLLENGLVQSNQYQAFEGYQKTLKTYEPEKF